MKEKDTRFVNYRNFKWNDISNNNNRLGQAAGEGGEREFTSLCGGVLYPLRQDSFLYNFYTPNFICLSIYAVHFVSFFSITSANTNAAYCVVNFMIMWKSFFTLSSKTV